MIPSLLPKYTKRLSAVKHAFCLMRGTGLGVISYLGYKLDLPKGLQIQFQMSVPKVLLTREDPLCQGNDSKTQDIIESSRGHLRRSYLDRRVAVPERP